MYNASYGYAQSSPAYFDYYNSYHFPPSYAQMAQKPPLPKSPDATGSGDTKYDCLIYIDNSNMYCEGKKYFATLHNFYVSEDRRFRVKFGEFIDLLIGNHHPLAAKFYFSNPAENAEFWDALEEKIIEYVHAERFRKSIFGKEKEVDNSITADIVDDLWVTDAVEHRVFIIASGDSDFLPALKKVLRNNCKAEVYAYTQALAKRVRELVPQYPDQLKIFDVGQMLIDQKCYFLSYLWNVKSSDRIWIPKERTLVFEYPTAQEEHHIEEMVDRCTSVLRFPCLYRKWDDRRIFVIVGGSAEEVARHCSDMYKKVNSQLSYVANISKLLTVDRFLSQCTESEIKASQYNFGSRFATDSDSETVNGDGEEEDEEEEGRSGPEEQFEDEDILALKNRFGSFLGDENFEQQVDDNDNFAFDVASDQGQRGTSSKSEGFKLVSNKGKKSKKKVRPCKYEFSCLNGVHCANEHTDVQRRFFQKHRCGVLFYKSKKCENKKCEFKRDTAICPYAHDLHEARCYKCHRHGDHWQAFCTK